MADSNVRYGAEIRKRAQTVYRQKVATYDCPSCGKNAVKRQSYAKWQCKSCGGIFAGGAYSFTTPTGEVSRRLGAENKKN
ncbi:50S ribosomal protein L37ae [Candidatus Parvarchaeota archaeon]|nr:50S ribosomal protein L37ae [Candidatus Parvarchaeota archaeon]